MITAQFYLSSSSTLRFQLRPMSHSSPESAKTANRKGRTKIWPTPPSRISRVSNLESSHSYLLPLFLQVTFSLNGNPHPKEHFFSDIPLALQIQLQETNLSPLLEEWFSFPVTPYLSWRAIFQLHRANTLALSVTCYSFFFILFLPDRLPDWWFLLWNVLQIGSFPYNPIAYPSWHLIFIFQAWTATIDS